MGAETIRNGVRALGPAAIVLEIAVAVALLLPTALALPARADAANESGDRQARTGPTTRWACSPRTPSWSAGGATPLPLWYEQIIEGQRTDVWIVDDRTRLDEHLGDVTDVIDSELGQRPVYLVRLAGDDLTRDPERLRRSRHGHADRPADLRSARGSARHDRDAVHRAHRRPPRVPELSYFFPAHNEEANLEGLVAEALATLPDAGRPVRDRHRRRRLARPHAAPWPTRWPRPTRTSCASSTTRRTTATARRCGRASGRRASPSSPSPMATASSRSPTSAG